MKKLILIITLIITVIMPATVFASDISDALFRGQLTISNTGSSTATGVATVASINTQDYIDLGYMDSDLGNVAIQNTAGLDTPFMPGYDGSPWCVYVDTINQNQYLPYNVYSKDATGGTIAYFPDAAGMSVDDGDISELGDVFRIGFEDGYLDTSVADVIAEKPGALSWSTDGAGNVTVSGIQTALSVKDNFETDNTNYGFYGALWLAQTFTPSETYTATGFQIKAYKTGNPGTMTVSIRATSGGIPTEVDLVSGTFNADTMGTVSPGDWYGSDFSSPYTLTSGTKYALVVRIPTGDSGNRIYWRTNSGGGYAGGNLYEAADSGVTWGASGYDNLFRVSGNIALTLSTAVPSVHYDSIELIADGTDLNFNLDGVTVDTVALGGASVPDNAAAWQFGSDATIYIGAIEVDVSGTPEARWVWEYGDTFTDSISSIVATPSFRTTSSDADVSAELVSFGPHTEARAPSYALGEEADQINITPSITGDFSTTPGTADFPLSGVITAVTEATGTPPQLPLTIIAAFVILAVSLTVSALMRRFGSGGIIPKTIAIVAVMGIFIGIGNFAFDLWMLIIFIIFAVALMFASKQIGWT